MAGVVVAKETGKNGENDIVYESEKPSLRPYIMIKGGLPKGGSYKMSGNLTVGSFPAWAGSGAPIGYANFQGQPIALDIPGNRQDSKCGFMVSEELGFKYEWVRLGLELGYMRTDTKVYGVAELLNLKSDAQIVDAARAFWGKYNPLIPFPGAAITADVARGLIDRAVRAKGYGDSWSDMTTKVRFHQPFGAINLTLDVPLNQYFTFYVGGGLGACYDVGVLYLNNEEKLVWRKMKRLWQGFAGLALNISDGWSLRGGYRLMRIDNKRYGMQKDNQEIGIEGGGTAKGFEVALMYHF